CIPLFPARGHTFTIPVLVVLCTILIGGQAGIVRGIASSKVHIACVTASRAAQNTGVQRGIVFGKAGCFALETYRPCRSPWAPAQYLRSFAVGQFPKYLERNVRGLCIRALRDVYRV